MAYPTVSAPYGLVPINRFDGMPYAGATQQLPIASTYNTAIYNGDVVLVSGGNIKKSAVTSDSTTDKANNATYGVFVGVQYVNTQGQTVQAQYYPGNAAATNAVAYVVMDPVAEFKVAVTYSGNSTISSTTAAAVGTGQFGSARGAGALGQAINRGMLDTQTLQAQALQQGYGQALQAAQNEAAQRLAAAGHL